MVEDLAVVSAAYRAMLEKLAAEVPNIDWDRSVIGGHSNGAHTLSVLLAGRDRVHHAALSRVLAAMRAALSARACGHAHQGRPLSASRGR